MYCDVQSPQALVEHVHKIPNDMIHQPTVPEFRQALSGVFWCCLMMFWVRPCRRRSMSRHVLLCKCCEALSSCPFQGSPVLGKRKSKMCMLCLP